MTIPSNAAIYYNALYELATFDLIPSDEIYGYLQEHMVEEEVGDDEEKVDEVTTKLSQ